MQSPKLILEHLIAPVGIAWSLMLLIALCSFARGRMFTTFLALVSAGVLSLFGSTRISAHLLAAMEQPYAGQGLDKVPVVDAIVMLGAGLSPSGEEAAGFHLYEGEANRIATTLELIKRGRARAVVIGGGGAPSPGRSDSHYVTNWISRLNLGPAELIALPAAADTREEALLAQAVCRQRGWKRIIVVTSGYHMKRAEAVYQRLGLDVVPVAGDFPGLTGAASRYLFDPVPSLPSIELLSLYLHERVGWIVYCWRGWINAGMFS